MANRAFGWNLKNHRKQMKENKKRLAYRKFIIRASEGRKAAIKVGLANGKRERTCRPQKPSSSSLGLLRETENCHGRWSEHPAFSRTLRN